MPDGCSVPGSTLTKRHRYYFFFIGRIAILAFRLACCLCFSCCLRTWTLRNFMLHLICWTYAWKPLARRPGICQGNVLLQPVRLCFCIHLPEKIQAAFCQSQ